MIKLFLARRRAQRVDFETAWSLIHEMQRHDLDAQFRHTMVALAERARDTAPSASIRAACEGWRKAYAEGRKVKTGVFKVRFLEPVPNALREAVDEAFIEEGLA